MKIIILALVTLVLAFVVGSSAVAQTSSPTTTMSPTTTPKPTTTVPSGAPATGFGR